MIEKQLNKNDKTSYMICKTTFLVFLGAFCLHHFSFGQSLQNDVIASNGSYARTGNISLEYTLGELSTESYTAGGMLLTQGFHQPFVMVTSDEHVYDLTDLRVFPNPLTDLLMVEIPLTYSSNFIVSILDNYGRILETHELNSGIHALQLNRYPPATYLLHVMQAGSTINMQFRVVKIK